MTGARDITQLCFSSNLAGIVANKIEQSFYSVYSYSGIEFVGHAPNCLKSNNHWTVFNNIHYSMNTGPHKCKQTSDVTAVAAKIFK